MQGNLISFARCHQGIVDNPPMLAHPWTPLRFHAFLDLIHRQMRGRSGDSMPHVGSSFPSICVFSSSLLFYHIEGELVSSEVRKFTIQARNTNVSPITALERKASPLFCSRVNSSAFNTFRYCSTSCEP